MTRKEFIHWFDGFTILTKNDIYELGQLYDEVTKPHWISVEDEMPPLDKDIVVYGKFYGSEQIGVDSLVPINGGDEFEWDCFSEVTHWIPLPQPPHHFADVSQKVKKGGKE